MLELKVTSVTLTSVPSSAERERLTSANTALHRVAVSRAQGEKAPGGAPVLSYCSYVASACGANIILALQ